MHALDPFTFDRRLAVAARSWRSFRRALREGSAAEHRFESDAAFASLELLDELTQAPAGVFGPAQQRWLLRLLEQRRHAQPLRLSHDAWRRETYPLQAPEVARLSPQGMLLRALADRARRAGFLVALAQHGSKLAAERLALWERRAELRERLRAERFDAAWLPGSALLDGARELLEVTRDAYLEHAPRDLAGLIELLLGSAAGGGFPAHLTTRSLIELLEAARWFESLRLEPDALPAPLAPASFQRGLAVIGAAFARAVKSELPAFAALRDPFDLGEHAHAALFAGLPLLPAFAQRRLDVPRHALADFRRRLGAAALAEARGQALRALLVFPALEGGRALREAFSDVFTRAFAIECDPRLAGVLFMPRFDQLQRLGGLLLAARRQRELVQRHDEDWFRNPRAREELRETARLPDPNELSSDDVKLGVDALARPLA